MLDLGQAEALIRQLQQADRTGQPVDPTLPLALQHARRETTTAFDAFERDPNWYTTVSTAGLIGAGLATISKWIKGL